jgi:hypothetical protein
LKKHQNAGTARREDSLVEGSRWLDDPKSVLGLQPRLWGKGAEEPVWLCEIDTALEATDTWYIGRSRPLQVCISVNLRLALTTSTGLTTTADTTDAPAAARPLCRVEAWETTRSGASIAIENMFKCKNQAAVCMCLAN